MESKLARAQAGKKPAAPSRFAQAISGAKIYEPWIVPRLGIECAITLVPTNRSQEIEGDVWKRMAILGLALNETTETTYELERAIRYAALAVVDRAEPHDPVGTVEEWGCVDADIVGEFWRAYGDVREAYDPVEHPLTDDEMAWIVAAIKKNEPRLLRLCGARRLATYVRFMAGRLSNSQPPTSGPTSSPPETSPSPADPSAAS